MITNNMAEPDRLQIRRVQIAGPRSFGRITLTVAPNICELSVCKLIYVSFLAPRILRCLPEK